MLHTVFTYYSFLFRNTLAKLASEVRYIEIGGNKEMKKSLLLLLVAGLLATALCGLAIAAEDETDKTATAPTPMPHYLSVTGTIDSIDKFEGQENPVRINITDADGNPATLILTDKTVYPFEKEPDIGSIVTGYYPSNAPMIMIWPPQYSIAVLVAGIPDDSNARADRFITEEYNTGNDLQNTPNIDMTGWPIVVDGVQIKAPAAFQTEDGIVMVPLRAITETLGYEVLWDTGTRSVTVNEIITLIIGDSNYHKADAENWVTIKGPEPVLKNGSTYVPLLFFSNILELPYAFAYEGWIEINSVDLTVE